MGMFGLFNKKKEKKEEKTPPAVTTSGGIVTPSDSSELIKSIIENASLNQPQLAEHVTGHITNYIMEIVPPQFRRIYSAVLYPAILLGDATGKELADILVELHVNRFRYTTGIRAVTEGASMDYDLYLAAAQPMLRLAKDSHLLHLSMRYVPIKVRGGEGE